jgi:hypothetical protein
LKEFLMIKFCPTCGKALSICFCLAVGSVPLIDAIHSPPEEHCSAALSCTERPLATEPWSPDAPEHDYGTTNQPAVELVAETGGAAAVPFGGWSGTVTGLPVGHHYLRSAALYGANDGWMGPLTLRSLMTSA